MVSMSPLFDFVVHASGTLSTSTLRPDSQLITAKRHDTIISGLIICEENKIELINKRIILVIRINVFFSVCIAFFVVICFLFN